VNHLALVFAPQLLDGFDAGTRRVFLYTFFKVGGLAVTPIFLAKALIFLVALVAVSHLVQKLLLSRLLRYVHVADAAKFAIGRFVTYALFLGGLFIGLQSLGVNLSSLVIFGGAVGVGVGLGLQNVVSNFVAGLILLIEQPIRMGDRIETGDVLGDVVRIAARSTWVRTNDNVVIIVPNSDFINSSVTNWTANDPNVRISIKVGVGYSSDPTKVREILLAAADANSTVLKEPKPDVLFSDYGDSSLDFILRVWTADAHTPAILKSELFFDLFQRFTAAGVELPFPQRDLHIRSSDIPLPFAGKPK
jgi:small-conductance mechanosensitive channel